MYEALRTQLNILYIIYFDYNFIVSLLTSKNKIYANFTDEALEGLFRNIDIIPATIRRKPSYNMNAPDPAKYSIDFEYHPNIDIHYTNFNNHKLIINF